MEKPDNRAFIYEISQAIIQVELYLAQANIEEFMQDRKLKDAVIYRLTVIGEASAQITKDYISEHPNIPWKDIVGMRHKLIHDYSEVDLDVVWKVAKEDLPTLKNKIQKLLTQP
ncbi:MAG: DUF86 domain-containing protein [Candidatus Berkelbacteria bacterium]|nr:DUF86 domain-containing protein [Candidatus Berkelbacteria bacterium]